MITKDKLWGQNIQTSYLRGPPTTAVSCNQNLEMSAFFWYGSGRAWEVLQSCVTILNVLIGATCAEIYLGNWDKSIFWVNTTAEFPYHHSFKRYPNGTSLVAQWLRIRLPMHGTWVQSPVREDPTCRGATKPAPQLLSPRVTTSEAHAPRARAPQQREANPVRSPRITTKNSPCLLKLEKALMQQQRPNTAKNK